MQNVFDVSAFDLDISVAKEKAVLKHLGHHGVKGVCTAIKVQKGIPTGELAITFLVDKKREVTGEASLPKTFEGFPVDVIECNFENSRKFDADLVQPPPDNKRYDPVTGGCSISIEDGTLLGAGTLGIIGETPGTFGKKSTMLTCGHVCPKTGEDVSQPGELGLGLGSDVCATVSDTCEENILVSSKQFYVDAAVATRDIIARKFTESNIVEIGVVTGVAQARIDDRVMKRGRYGLSYGKVTSIDATVKVDGSITAYNVILIQSETTDPFSYEGDSGSMLVRVSDNCVVGLVFAGMATTSGACHIGPVLGKMQFTIPFV